MVGMPTALDDFFCPCQYPPHPHYHDGDGTLWRQKMQLRCRPKRALVIASVLTERLPTLTTATILGLFRCASISCFQVVSECVSESYFFRSSV